MLSNHQKNLTPLHLDKTALYALPARRFDKVQFGAPPSGISATAHFHVILVAIIRTVSKKPMVVKATFIGAVYIIMLNIHAPTT